MLYALGPLVVDTDRLALMDGDRPISVAPKVVEVIALLCDHQGAFVPKDALRDRLWPGGDADDSVLWQKIYLARKTLEPYLGAGAIETLPRRGYRLTTAATTMTTAVAIALPARVPSIVAKRRFPPMNAVVLGLAMSLAFFAVAPSLHTSRPERLAASTERAYNLGRYFLSRRTFDGALEAERYFAMVAASADGPAAALGYAGLADAHIVLAGERKGARGTEELRLARGAAETACRLDPASGVAAAALGAVLFARDVTLARGKALGEDPAARSLFARAVALGSADATGERYYGQYLLFRGDARAAAVHLQSAIDLDPASPIANIWLAEATYVNGDPQAAATYASRALAFGTSDREDAFVLLGLAEDRQRRPHEALAFFHRLGRFAPEHANVLEAYLEAEHGAPGPAERRLASAMQHRPCDCGAFWLTVALTQTMLGKQTAAAESIRRMGRSLRGEAHLLSLDPRLALLRSNPQLRTLLHASLGA